MAFGSTEIWSETAPRIFGEFLPEALAVGTYKVALEPLLMDMTGLEGIQRGIDRLRDGVSARKVVVIAV